MLKASRHISCFKRSSEWVERVDGTNIWRQIIPICETTHGKRSVCALRDSRSWHSLSVGRYNCSSSEDMTPGRHDEVMARLNWKNVTIRFWTWLAQKLKIPRPRLPFLPLEKNWGDVEGQRTQTCAGSAFLFHGRSGRKISNLDFSTAAASVGRVYKTIMSRVMGPVKNKELLRYNQSLRPTTTERL